MAKMAPRNDLVSREIAAGISDASRSPGPLRRATARRTCRLRISVPGSCGSRSSRGWQSPARNGHVDLCATCSTDRSVF